MKNNSAPLEKKSKLAFLDEGTPKQQKQKKILLYVILSTVAALVLSLSVFLTVGIISLVKDDAGDPDNSQNNEQNNRSDNSSGGQLSGYISSSFSADQKNNGNLLLIDDSHLFAGSASTVLVNDHRSEAKVYSIEGTTTLGGTEEAVIALNSMIEAFYLSTQNDCLYVYNAHRKGSDKADIFASGLCFTLTYVDMNDKKHDHSIYNESEYSWIYDNAHKYGFVQLYPASADDEDTSKANIFRYVGEPHASYMKRQGLTLDKYLELLKTKTPDKALSLTDSAGNKYKVYYLTSAGGLVPSDASTYTVSGDNMGGYVVTVCTSKKAAS